MSSNEPSDWVSEHDLRDLGFTPTGPEHDLGHRLGEQGTIRVSFAPCGSPDFGYVYAYDSATDRYAMLAASTTLDTVLSAYAAAGTSRPTPDGYLALADVLDSEHSVSLAHARELWLHCAQAEAHIRHDYERLPINDPERFTAAHRFIVARGARVAAEDIMLTSLQPEHCPMNEPVVIGYRIPQRSDWVGRVAGPDIEGAAFRIADLAKATAQFGYDVQATQVTHGHNRIPAARLRELAAFTRDIDAGPSNSIEL